MKFVYVLEMLIVRHLGTPNSDFNGCHCMRDPVLYRSMVQILCASHFSSVRKYTSPGFKHFNFRVFSCILHHKYPNNLPGAPKKLYTI